MKRFICLLAAMPLLLTGCLPTRIVTVSPNNVVQPTYGTVVTVPRTGVTTTTSCVVTPLTNDLSLYLDLQAVGAAFAQSANIQEFESLLNNTSYIISNLDLNGDGMVDYLRVLEQVQGTTHIFVIQAVLGANIYQDVATLVAEVPSVSSYYVQVIGAPFIYGPNYIIRPVYYTRPHIFDYFFRPYYDPWRSPWHWGYFPSYYRHPAPLHISHYQAYVNTYMMNHRYCHGFEYASSYHYNNFGNAVRDLCRNDYEQQHPEKSFITRTAEINSNGVATSVTNARDIRERSSAATTTSSTTRGGVTTNSRASATQAARSEASSSSSASTSTPTRTATTSTSRSSTTTSAPASTSSATQSSRSSSSATSRSATTSSGSSSSTSTSRPSTTVQSRVNTSGTSSTRTTTVSPSGATSTVSRGSSSSSSRSSYSAPSSSSSSSRSSSSSSSRSSYSAPSSSSSSSSRVSSPSGSRSSSSSSYSSPSRSSSSSSSSSSSRSSSSSSSSRSSSSSSSRSSSR